MKKAWITTMDTLCEGVTAAWRQDDGRPFLYDSRMAAEKDANEEEWIAMGNDPDGVEEVMVTDDAIIGVVDGRVYWRKSDRKACANPCAKARIDRQPCECYPQGYQPK
jgi:hypothetical protein